MKAIATRLEAIASRLEAIAIRLEAIASRLEVFAIRLEAIATRLGATASRLEAMAIRLEAIATRLEAIATRLEAIASRLEAIAIRLEAIASRLEAFACIYTAGLSCVMDHVMWHGWNVSMPAPLCVFAAQAALPLFTQAGVVSAGNRAAWSVFQPNFGRNAKSQSSTEDFAKSKQVTTFNVQAGYHLWIGLWQTKIVR